MFGVLQFPDSGLDCLFSVSSRSVPQSCFCVSLVAHVCVYSTFDLVKVSVPCFIVILTCPVCIMFSFASS